MSIKVVKTNTILRFGINKPTRLTRQSSAPTSTECEKDISESLNCNVSSFNDPGYTRNKRVKINHNTMGLIDMPYTEDRMYRETVFISNKKHILLCVADGHGGLGCSKFIMGRIAIYSRLLSLESTGPNDFISRLFDFLHQETLKPEFKLPIIGKSGSTLCVGLIDTESLILTTGNLGDSVCQVIRTNKDIGSRTQVFRTIDHDASNIDEQNRVRTIDPNAQFTWDNDCYRLNGLMVIGGFGDWNADVPLGVIRRSPTISTFQLESNDVVIVSSDGLFEEIKSVGRIGPGRNESEIAEDVDNFFSQSTELSISKFIHDSHINRLVDDYLRLNSQPLNNPRIRSVYYKSIITNNDNNAILVYNV